MELYVFTDGGSRGNPGIAGLGVLITYPSGDVLEKRFKNLGIKTNNQAEYLGAYFGIKRAKELGAKKIVLHMDSKLVIEQLSGTWKVKNPDLMEIYSDIQMLCENVAVEYVWIPREKNREADRLSNVAMDVQ